MNPPIIRVQHLSKSVADSSGHLDILSDISFQLECSQSLAIVGASGSGKSTLLGLLAGLDTPTRGEVWLAGKNLFAMDEDSRARWRGQTAGFVFQSFQLLGNLTALENVMLPLELAGSSLAREKATEMLDRVGLAPRLHHYPRTLSGGEQQRVALARAFVLRPAVVFADEPTGSLDQHTGGMVMDLLFQMNTEFGTTLVLVTHDASLASRCSQRLHLQSGRC
jgi:putative ABC transport system ATP-binding protein